LASVLTKAELVELVERIADPNLSDLIFHGIGGRELSFAEVVDCALAYEPTRLPLQS
jgi:hypothetical protein